MTYRFGAGWKFLRLVPRRTGTIAGRPKGFGLWIYGDGRQTSPRLRVTDASGKTWQPAGESIGWNGWRYVRFELESSTPHWGGADDGIIHFPLAWDSLFLLDNPSRNPTEGTIYLAAPVVIY